MTKTDFQIADELATEVDTALRCKGCHATVRGAILDGMEAARASQREACAVIVDDAEVIEGTGNTYYAQLGDASATLKAAAAAIRADGLTPANRCDRCGVNPVDPSERLPGAKLICSECSAFFEGGF